MTFNISLRIIVGKRFSATTYGEEKSEACRFRSAIKEALYLSGVFVLSDAFPHLEWMDHRGHVSSMKRTAKELDSVLEIWLAEHLQKRLEQKSDGDSDFMDVMLSSFPEDVEISGHTRDIIVKATALVQELEQKSDGDSDFMDVMLSSFPEDVEISGHTRDIIVKATALILLLTGAGSTSTTLTWAISLLLNHPSVLKAAQEELDMHVGKDKWVEESDMKNLKYLHAIVKETLRLYPPGPLTGIREAMEDCTVGGYFVPKGTRLLVNIWKLQRDPRVWSNPSEFQPERFMTTHANIDVRGQNFEYIPFSSGRRSCPAITYGMQVVHLALARVLQGFDMTTMASVKVDMLEGPGIALPKVNPLDVVLKPRLPLESY
nr:cytochrome p450 82g1 [Quercus suber]